MSPFEITFTIAVLLWIGWSEYRHLKTEEKVNRVFRVMEQLGPEFGRRLQEQGTGVVLADKWEDLYEFTDITE